MGPFNARNKHFFLGSFNQERCTLSIVLKVSNQIAGIYGKFIYFLSYLPLITTASLMNNYTSNRPSTIEMKVVPRLRLMNVISFHSAYVCSNCFTVSEFKSTNLHGFTEHRVILRNVLILRDNNNNNNNKTFYRG